MTNYEKIKAMSIEEMVDVADELSCFGKCGFCTEGTGPHCDGKCDEHIAEWLESEAE